jgi:hypothetical protein
LQNLAPVACSTGVVDRGVWLRISRQYLSCALFLFVVVALCFAITTEVWLKVLERIFVMALLCHSSDFGCS